ncbi:hypothetical protein I3843_03G050100 [Carya illinoinensis]|nr:hypothetical protein I3843_03G050100 [Carya illinoinensis]
MAFVRGSLLGLSASWFFYVLVISVLAVQPHRAHGLSRGFVGPKKTAVAPPAAGICASSVTVHGYKCQELEVTTQDGYILSLQRIPEGRVRDGVVKRQPVLIQHGLLVDGMTWLLNPPEQNLPMILADNGFDVWIANTRGTRFSRRHTSLDSNQPAFWNWSWDELVSFDLPAVFDFVYGQTGQKIDYGTLVALASFSEGNLVKQLKSAALLSPIAYLSHMSTALGVVAAKFFVGEIVQLLGLTEFNIKEESVRNLLKSLCARPGVDCYDLMSALTGKNCCLNSSTIDLLLVNEPQSTSVKNMVHLAQTMAAKTHSPMCKMSCFYSIILKLTM